MRDAAKRPDPVAIAQEVSEAELALVLQRAALALSDSPDPTQRKRARRLLGAALALMEGS